LPHQIVSREQQTKSTPAAPKRAENAPQNGASDRHKQPGKFRAKLSFFRLILWILVYATSALFLMSLILLRFRMETIIIGGALLACISLVVATYAIEWRR
jgi:hypothetical protein